MRTTGVLPLMAVSLCAALVSAAGIDGDWPEKRSAGPFICRADFSLENQPFLPDLTRLHADLIRCLGIKPSNEVIDLYLFRDQSRYRNYLAQNHPNLPSRRALYVRSSGPGMVFAYFSERLSIDLRHETTHAILHAALADVPLWLDEGLAGYFEVGRQRIGGNAHLAAIQQLARRAMLPSLTALEAKSDLSQMGATEYRDAWAWVHFTLNGPKEAQEELIRFLPESRKAHAAKPLSVRLLQRMPDLHQRFVTHFAYRYDSWASQKEERDAVEPKKSPEPAKTAG
jgi:hypothetical protein